LQRTDGTVLDLPELKLQRNVNKSFVSPRHEFRAMNFVAAPNPDLH
jgi:hypothetical protein